MARETRLLLSVYIPGIYSVDSSFVPEPSTFTGRTWNPSSRVVSEIPTGRLSLQAYNISQICSFSSTVSNGSYGLTSTITAPPPGTSNTLDTDEQDGRCYLGNQDCTYTGMTTTVVGPDQPLHLNDECLLWNTSCTENKTLALDELFGGSWGAGTLAFLQGNECFVDPHNTSLDCSKYVSQDIMSEFAVIKDWMRSP